MKYLTEKQVLKKLDIPDFRHLSKDNVMKFASMIPDMEIEVAQKALDQFPNLTSTSLEALKDCRPTIENVIKSENDSTQQCYIICNRRMDMLNDMLNKCQDPSFEQQMIIMEYMKDVNDMASAKDTEHKRFLAGIVAAIGAVILGTVAMLTSTLGNKIELSHKDNNDEGKDCNSDTTDEDE